MSRFPRIDLSNLEFNDGIKNHDGFMYQILEKEFSRSYDFLSNKSVLGGLFKVSEKKKVFLFTSHVQALGSSENKGCQLEQIINFIKSGIKTIFDHGIIKKEDELSVIFAGDLNIDAYSSVWRLNRVTYPKLLEYLNKPRDLYKEYNGDKIEHTWTLRSNPSIKRMFDYVFAYDSLAGQNFSKVFVDKIDLIDILDSNNVSISDHRGISTKLKLKR